MSISSRRRVASGVGLVGVLCLGVGGCMLTGSGRAAWREDFDAVVAHLGTSYANLEWIVERRGLDLAVLRRETIARIDTASTHPGCAGALRDFVAAFHDPHLRLREPWHASVTLALRGFTFSAVPGSGFELDFDDLPGFEELPRGELQPFPAGVLTLAQGQGGTRSRRVGVLRIATFGLDDYGACEREARERLRTETGAREEVDAEHALFVEVGNAILRRLRERILELRGRAIDSLLIDLTGNGGGTDWVDPAARLCTSVQLQAPRSGLIRDARTVADLVEALRAVQADLARGDLAADDRTLLEEAVRRLEAERVDASIPVDRRALFEATGARPASSLLASADAFTSGVFPYLPPAALRGVPSRTELFRPLQFEWQEGVWDGPLFVLVDGRTASASEYFAAILRDNDAAVILGEPTLGAGGGYVDGGAPLTLPHSAFVLEVPNCCRLRRDGTNEIERMVPDVAIDLSAHDGPARVAEALARQLAGR